MLKYLSVGKSCDCGVFFRKNQESVENVKKTLCIKGGKLANQTKAFPANPKEIKRQPPNSKGQMLQWFFDKLIILFFLKITLVY